MNDISRYTKKRIPLAFIFLLATSLQGCGGSTSVEEHLQQARASFAKYDLKSSEIELKNVLQQDTNNSAARLLLGQIYLTIGNAPAAIIEINKAIQTNQSSDTAFSLLGDALLLDGKADEILTRFASNPTETDSLKAVKATYRGDANLQLKDIDSAKSAYQTALQYDAQNDRTLLGMARIAILENKPDKALELTNSVLSKDPNHVMALLTKADVYRALGNKSETISAFTQAAHASNPKEQFNFIAIRNLTIEHLQNGNLAEAEKQLQILVTGPYKQRVTNDPMLSYTQAIIAYDKKDLATAKEIAERIVANTNNFPQLQLLLGSINFQTKNYEQAETQLKAFLATSPRNKQATRLLATLQVIKQHPEEAVETLKQSLDDSETPDLTTLALLANASLRSGDSKQGEHYYQKALEQKPEESGLIYGLGQSYLMQGEHEKAIAEFAKIPEDSNQSLRAQLTIIETYMKAGRTDEALATIQKLPNETQQTAIITSLKGTVYLMQKNLVSAQSQFNKSLEIEPGYAPAHRQLALLATQAGDSATVIKHFEEAINANPKNSNLVIDYAGYQMQQGELKKAESLLKQAKEIGTSKERIATMLARLHLRQRNPSAALTELNPFYESTNPEIQAEIGNTRMLMGDPQTALAAYEKVVAARSNSPLAHYLTYTALSSLNKTELARAALQKTLALDGKYVPALLASAQVAISEGKADEATKWLTLVESVDASNYSAKILKADNAMLQNNAEQGITLYKAAYNERSNNTLAQKITSAYWKLEQKQNAITFLNESIKTQANNAFLPYLLGSLYLGTGNTELAIKSYQQSIALNANNVIALNNLAWLLKESDIKKARAYAEKAIELAPGNKDIEDTLAEIKLLDR